MTGPVSWSLLVHSSAEYFIVKPIITKCGARRLTDAVQKKFMRYALQVIITRAQIPMNILLRVLVYLDRVKPELAGRNNEENLIYAVFDGALMRAGTVR